MLQLSTRYADEGIEFPSLNQSEQGVLKADVLHELHLATQGNRVAASEWDTLKMTMKAYGGVASVSLARRSKRGSEETIVSEKGGEQTTRDNRKVAGEVERTEYRRYFTCICLRAGLHWRPGPKNNLSPKYTPQSFVYLILIYATVELYRFFLQTRAAIEEVHHFCS